MVDRFCKLTVLVTVLWDPLTLLLFCAACTNLSPENLVAEVFFYTIWNFSNQSLLCVRHHSCYIFFLQTTSTVRYLCNPSNLCGTSTLCCFCLHSGYDFYIL